MSLNVNLLLKLARLANENPNENEANLAARKVCQLLKQANYQLSITTPINTNSTKQKEPWVHTPKKEETDAYKDLRDLFNRYKDDFYWRNNNEFRGGYRSGKSNLKYKAYYNPSIEEVTLPNGIRMSKVEFFSRNLDRDYDLVPEINESPPKVPPNYSRENYDIFGNKIKEEKPKQKLKCSVCGEEVLTSFVGLPQLYRCNTCIWR